MLEAGPREDSDKRKRRNGGAEESERQKVYVNISGQGRQWPYLPASELFPRPRCWNDWGQQELEITIAESIKEEHLQ
jgi:hypothetical protein